MRIALKMLLGLALLLALAGLTLPWWLGAALSPLGRARGLTFERYETVGYARFRLERATFARPGLTFSAQQATLDTPLLWLLRRAHAHVEISKWTLSLAPVATRAQPGDAARATPSPLAIHDQVHRIAQSLRRWLPRATAESGAIVRGEQTWRIARATWADGTLEANGALPSGQDVRATFATRGETLVVAATAPEFSAQAELAWSRDAVRIAGNWLNQPFALDARFGEASWIPARAELRAENWDLPAAQVKLAPSYERLRANVHARWADDAFTVEFAASATPASGQKSPPLEFAARATGDRRQVVLQTLQVRAPFANATLSAPLAIAFDGSAAAAPAVFAINADLAQQSWFDAAGKLVGEIRAEPRGWDSHGTFSGSVEAFRWRTLAARSGRIRGNWHGTRVELEEISATLDGESSLAAHGTVDWARRELRDARLDATLATAWIAPLLPRGLAFEKVVASIAAEGPLAALRHRGELNASNVRVSHLRPLALAAHWEGDARTLRDFSVSARSQNAALQLTGSLDAAHATIGQLALLRDGRELLHAVAPSEIHWGDAWKIAGLRLEGGESSLALDADWSDAPSFFVSAQKISSDWLAGWWTDEILPCRIDALTARGQTRSGVLLGEVQAEVAAEIVGSWLQGRLAASAQPDGFRVTQLEVADASGLMAYATGRLPARIRWANAPQLELDQAAPLELDASIAPDSPLWEILRARTDLAIAGGSVVASVSGSLQQPRGLVHLEATRIARHDSVPNDSAQAITDFAATLRGRRDGIQLESLDARVAGHPIHASGQLPMSAASWRTLLRQPREFDWRTAEAQLAAAHIELPALAQTFPALPMTHGTLAAEVHFARGELTGHAELRAGESRPLPGLGRLLAIEVDLSLAGRRVDVRTFSAQLGGEPVELTGTAALDSRERLDLDLRLRAKNVPLVRRPGLLVRTDLDLRAQTPARGPTRITGSVELRDALVMADLAAILPGGPRGAARTPPYFSVPNEPFSRWPLDVRIGGHRAVRVNTAVFRGVATPQFHLTGTLGDPRAIGQLAVEEGQVLFPFARFDVQQGAVRLTEAEPTQPRLAVNAISKRMGYELRLEAGGTLAAPTLAFTSNPPLESADILLLVTAGQPPKDEISAPTNQQRLTRLGTFLGTGIFQNFGGTEDRLEITSGEQLSESGRETYRVEYKLRDKLSLTGEYDRFDDYNAGVKYRLYKQEGAMREVPKK